jgi:hypothetical protein
LAVTGSDCCLCGILSGQLLADEAPLFQDEPDKGVFARPLHIAPAWLGQGIMRPELVGNQYVRTILHHLRSNQSGCSVGPCDKRFVLVSRCTLLPE